MRAEAAPSFLWVPELSQAPGAVELSRDETHYLKRVCRARVGDRALATDGCGVLAELIVVALGDRVRAEVVRLERAERGRRAWVLCGPPEGRRADWLVEKLAELGVAVWQPLECARGGWHGVGGAIERWRRLAIAALRQSRRRFLMEIREPKPVAGVAQVLPEDGGRWIADPAGRRGLAPPAGDECALGAIGPAGGFDAAERDCFSTLGFEPICLSEGRLRTETAAIAWAAWWGHGG